ncbi:MAG: DNA primase, partial [Candidatus Gracilibacteria bacterium]
KFVKKEKKGEKDEYFKAHELACDFFQEKLLKTNDGKKVLEYLYKRGVKDETIAEFRIGFAPDEYNVLYPYLLKKGISKKVLVKSGFVSQKTIASDEIYDKFRGRLMFPIFDYLGRICGFGGRALTKDQMPKYLNSPENVVYNKSSVLYGFYHSKKYVKELSQVILVEGYFDMILPYQEGVKNIVAVSGTALTEKQVKLIKRLTSNVVTCFDLDGAGYEATKRSYFILRNDDLFVKTVSGFKGKDPADLVCEKGGKAFSELVKEAPDFVSFYIDKLLEGNDVSKLEGRRVVIGELLPLYKKMEASTKDFYVKKLSRTLNMSEKFLYDEIQNFRLPADHPAKQAMSESSFDKVKVLVDKMILALIIQYPELFSKLSELVTENDFDGETKDVYKVLFDQYNRSRSEFKRWNFDDDFLAERRGEIDVLSLYAEERYGSFSVESLAIEVEKLVDKLRKTRRGENLAELQVRIAEAEKLKEKDKLMELLKEQQKLLSV